MVRVAGIALLLLGLTSCSVPDHPRANRGVLDLSSYDWTRGAVLLDGEWGFGEGWRPVPDAWFGDAGGGPDGRGNGTYRLRVLMPADSPPLALRYRTASTAMAIRVDGKELARAGRPDADAARAVSGYAPGTVSLPMGDLDIEIQVSNHEYRVGGLWDTPQLGPAQIVQQARWYDETAALALSAALTMIGIASALLFLHRRSNKSFLHLGAFALLVAVRCLVTGEYTLVRLLPGIPFDLLIRAEYLTAFLPFPSAVLFFAAFFPGFLPRWGVRLMTWPSWAFAIFALTLPLDWLTRSIPWFYPLVVPALVIGTVLLVRRIRKDRQGLMLLVGAALLAATGLTDMVTAAIFSTTGTLVPWGLGLFVILQATTLTRQFLAAFDATEALLAEKELLVKEVHHRVKNSLQVVASLVSLQANRTGDPEVKAVFRALRQRITTVSLVHEKLYGQEPGARPELSNYLTDLLRLQYPDSNSGVRWEIHTDTLRAGVDYCTDTGLIVTELVGNAHKHALLPRGGGILSVAIAAGDRLEIEVRDDGPGFPEGFSPDAAKGLGFRLVKALMQRNEGRLSWRNEGGACVQVSLKLPGD